MLNQELAQTLVLIKPDALKNSLTGYVLSQLSEFHSGLRFAGTKVVHVPEMLAGEHYAEHRGKVFFPSLVEYIRGKLHYPDAPQKQRVIAIVYQGKDAVCRLRDLVGPTNPHKAREEKPGSIRSLGTVVPLFNEAGYQVGDRWDNLIHASATDEEAEREIKLWFRPNDIPPYMRIYPARQSDRHYYFLDDRLLTEYEPGSICLFAPGDEGWTSDLDALKAILQGAPSPVTLQSVAAKYLTNREGEED
ncbi:MAG: nucleoside-diphosphate kinase [Armatimonadota bacterium]